MPRLLLALALAGLAVDAQAQAAPPAVEPPYVQVTLLPSSPLSSLALLAGEPGAQAVRAPSERAPAADSADVADRAVVPEVIGDGLVTAVVEAPAPVEDPVQFRMPRAPVRMELAQSRRRVVLLPGVGEREAAAFPASVPEAVTVGHVTYSRATVLVREGGAREVVFLDGATPTIDLGAVTGCDGRPFETALALRGLRATPLRRGMRGDAVRAAQDLLCAAGEPTEANGLFDARMDAAVRGFQRRYNERQLGPALAVDGALGPKTRKALDVAIAARTEG